NPRDLGTIIAVIGAIEFGGYAVERMAGPRLGSLATGFFGGLASSTAVFMSLPKLVRENPDATRFHVGTGLMANAASLIVMAGILVMTSNPLAVSTGLPVVIAAIACAILGYVITRKESNAKRQTVERA